AHVRAGPRGAAQVVASRPGPEASPRVRAVGAGHDETATSLIIMLSIDQFRPDYFDRFGAHLTGGLKRIREGSAFFPNGRQNDARTQAAPGHASMLSGRYPASTGILTNDHGVPDAWYPLLGRSTA